MGDQLFLTEIKRGNRASAGAEAGGQPGAETLTTATAAATKDGE